MNYKRYLLNILYIFLIEIVFNIALFNKITYYFFYILLFSILTGIIISLITGFLNESVNKISNIVINSVITLIFIAQLIHYRFYQSIFSIYSLINGAQVFGFMSAIEKIMLHNTEYIIFLLFPLFFFIVLGLNISFKKYTKKELLILIGIIPISLLLSILVLNTDKDKNYNAKDLYYNTHAPTISTQKLGLLTTMRLDLKRAIFGFTDKIMLEDKEIEEVNKSENKKEYNILNIDFDKLIEEEDNDKIRSLHKYFKNMTPTEKNKYSGMFKDKNLIVITAEAFSPIAIDKELTPTLYKMYTEGFSFSNFYTPIFYVSTSDGEYVSLTSLLPKEGLWSFQESSKISLPFVYGNILKDYGYSANAYHNGRYNYYKRNLSHPNMGYKYIGCGNGLEKKINCKIWPQSDLEMINATIDDYIENEKFLAYYMSISGHLNYTYNGNMMATKNRDKVKNLKYSEAIQAYLATNIELDKALESLINSLKEKVKLDDTVIVISADHYPYGLTINEMKERATYINDEKFDIHKNNLIIWNSQIKTPIKIDKYASSLDILPTVLNLLGVEYDSRLLMGTDILSNSEGLVIFNDRSWITKYGKYDAIKGKFTEYINLEEKQKYIDEINEIVKNKFNASRLILETNYYKYIKTEE
ncbi:MAG: LTA synthase family protein [Clostridium sp.]|nr:LTA synthase family protein [Clostridium sp.]